MGNKDLSGMEFGKLTILRLSKRRLYNKPTWEYLCNCGNSGLSITTELLSGTRTSCRKGECYKGTHNLYGKGPYFIWKTMRQRCNNPNSSRYSRYGGRGIVICDEWNQYDIFYQWALSSGYKKGLSIERINNDGNYCPENCTWIPVSEQGKNKKHSNKWIKLKEGMKNK